MMDIDNNLENGHVDDGALEMGDSRTQLKNSFHGEHQTEVTLRVQDADIIIRGYERSFIWTLFIWLLIILTAGMLGLVLLYWKPDWMLKLTHSVCPLATARVVRVEDTCQQKFVRRVYTTSSMSETSMRQPNQLKMFLPLPESKSLVTPPHDSNGIYVLNDEGTAERLPSIRWFQYQKHKFIWDAASSTFRQLVGPNSLDRAAVDTERGLSEPEVKRRQMLLGKNELLIKVYSPLQTLVLEALNPFYIFQVYSFIVWYSENYIYFAWVIVAMSALSLIYTTWQTHYLQRMRRDRFQSSGTVQVIRHDADEDKHNRQLSNNYADERRGSANGFVNFAADRTDHAHWHSRDDIAQLPVNTDQVVMQHSQPNGRTSRASNRRAATPIKQAYEKTVDSNQLVPGDIIIIPPHGCEMYCDAILLNGTCLVNEATLTGESVPVTKAAVERISSHDDDDEATEFDTNDSGTSTPTQHATKQERLFYLSPTSSEQQRALGGTSKNMLYAGTKVIQTRYYNSEPVKAVVMRTGYCTVKGELVTSILYPKPVDFSFHNDAMKFLIVLAFFACVGMIYTFVILKINGSPNSRLVLRALDLVTIVVPPALPFAMTMGIVHAQSRLRKAGLFCISPRMINMAGSIDLVCLDKTGTLTEDGLTLRGSIPVVASAHGEGQKRLAELIPAKALNTENRDDNVKPPTEQNPQRRRSSLLRPNRRRSSNRSGTDSYMSYRNESFLDENPGNTCDVPQQQQQQQQLTKLPAELEICMATCHELTLIDDTLCGDPLDLEMFRATEWGLEEPNVNDSDKYDQIVPTIVRPSRDRGNGELQTNNHADDVSILRVMSFESKLQRMSVVIRRATKSSDSTGSGFSVCTKGAPEKIASLCLPESVPDNFTEILTSYAQNGDRVLAMARRPLPPNIKFTRLQRMSRDELERDLEFVGFIVFENRLKPQTMPCIRELKSACIRPVMVTGDNLLTALSVGRQCNIVDSPEVSILDLVDDGNGQKKLRRRVMNDSGGSCRESVLEPIPAYYSASTRATLGNAAASIVNMSHTQAQCCVLTGDTFQMLHDGKNPTDYYQVLQNGAIFARMTPAQKELLVVGLRHAGFFVGMCGDGANDCGALKTAHMGISLSDQEASAAAPYTYKHANVSCVPTCIKEGRAALDTSFAAFKYMAAYSLAQFLSAMILYATNTNLSDFDFLYIDLFEVTLIVIVFGVTKASPKLARTAPQSRLIGLVPLLSMGLQVALVLAIQVAAYLIVQAQPWYVSTVDISVSNLTSRNFAGTSTTTTTAASVTTNVTGNASNTDDAREHYFSYQNYAVFGVSTFQYVWLAVAFSRGLPYRKLIFTNWIFTLLCLVLTALNVFLILKPCSWVIWMLELKLPPTWSFRWVVIGLAAINFLLAIIIEWWFIAWLNKRMDRKRRRRKEVESTTAALLSLAHADTASDAAGMEMNLRH